jgi:hypothetical protein
MLIINIFLFLVRLFDLHFEQNILLCAKSTRNTEHPIPLQEPRPYNYQRDLAYQQPGCDEAGTSTIIQANQITIYNQPSAMLISPYIKCYSQTQRLLPSLIQPQSIKSDHVYYS